MEGQEASVVTDYVIKILGLETCADTVVKSEMRRGISGGQKKRVTTGEMLVGPSKAFFMDEIIDSLNHAVHILQGTTLISLLQPAPETYDLFDDIIVLSDGYIVYQGPRESVVEFFESMGFKCPDRKGVADFLQEVTSKQDQEQYWLHKDEPYRFITAQDFSEPLQAFHVGRRIRDELKTPFDKIKSHPAALTRNKYGVRKMDLLKACASREFFLMKKNTFVYIFKSTQLCIMAFITMTIFLKIEMYRDSLDDGNIYLGALFFSVRTIMFNGLSEMSMTTARLPVFYKQRDLLFYPPWSYALPSWIVKIPLSFIEAFVWVFLTYYVIGLHPNVGRLFKQYILLVLVDQIYSTLFRCIAAMACPSLVSWFGAVLDISTGTSNFSDFLQLVNFVEIITSVIWAFRCLRCFVFLLIFVWFITLY